MEDTNRQPAPQDMDTVRFISLVSMFASSAYSSMGKIANPATGKIERDLETARGFIDILVMLKAKTKGNLSKDEEKYITSAVSDLQMNFVKEKEKPEPKPEPAAASEEKAEEKVEPDAAAEEPPEKEAGEDKE